MGCRLQGHCAGPTRTGGDQDSAGDLPAGSDSVQCRTAIGQIAECRPSPPFPSLACTKSPSLHVCRRRRFPDGSAPSPRGRGPVLPSLDACRRHRCRPPPRQHPRRGAGGKQHRRDPAGGRDGSVATRLRRDSCPPRLAPTGPSHAHHTPFSLPCHISPSPLYIPTGPPDSDTARPGAPPAQAIKAGAAGRDRPCRVAQDPTPPHPPWPPPHTPPPPTPAAPG